MYFVGFANHHQILRYGYQGRWFWCNGFMLSILYDAITLYIGGIQREGDSQEFYARTSPLNNGNLVKLFVQGFGEVEIGFVVEV